MLHSVNSYRLYRMRNFMTNDNITYMPLEDKYYFWLGNQSHGPFEDYAQAHLEMSRIIRENNGSKENTIDKAITS